MPRHLFCLGTILLLLSSSLLAAQENSKPIIGRTEMVCLTEWGVALKAKIDTGAYSSSLHVLEMEEMSSEPERVRFRTVGTEGKVHTIEAPVEKHVGVQSSFGQVKERLAVRTRLCLAGQEIEALVSLADRSDMRFPMLIGRKILKGRFLVDPALVRSKKSVCCRQPSSLISP
jgi:hypothetical protein